MGNLLRLIATKEDASDQVFVDFENCQPSPEEQELWNEVNAILKRSDGILDNLRDYSGASLEIRDAISNHSNEPKQQVAWTAVLPLVSKLETCFKFALEIGETVPKILSALCSSDMTVQDHLEKQQSLFKQFAEILDFVLKFDDIKMLKPSIQNDFSFYRRSCSRKKNNPHANSSETSGLLREDFASKMSMFYAEATPMLKMVSKCTSEWMAKENTVPLELATECLASMSQICRGLVGNPELRRRIHNEDTLMLCLRVMTAVIILYDHIEPEGVFRKNLRIDVRACIRLLKEQEYKKVENLLNALRYSTIHFNEDSTPRHIKQLLMT